MDLTAEAIEALKDAALVPTVHTVEGRAYLVRPSDVTESKDKHATTWGVERLVTPLTLPAPLKVRTLTGLVDYLKENRDGLPLEHILVHVESPTTAAVRSALMPEFAQRSTFCAAEAPPAPSFGGYKSKEEFGIWLATQFVETETRNLLMGMCARMKDGTVREFDDDGVVQTVTVREGATLVGERALPNPVALAPYRTFREVEQPESLFVFRGKGGDEKTPPSLALFEADGGAWQLEAIQRVAAYLREALAERGVAVLA